MDKYLIINADEPMFNKIDEIKNDTILNKKRNKFYYGFEEIEIASSNIPLEQKNDLIKCTENHRLNSMPGEIKETNYLRINNTNISAEKVAKIIKEKFKI